MKEQDFKQATFSQIISQNHRFGFVLDTFGIDFISEPERKLIDACLEKELDFDLLVHKLKNPKTNSLSFLSLSFEKCSQIIKSLKESHRYFMRLKLPYMLRVIEKMDIGLFEDKELAADLKWVFPMFFMDFSAHILQEEETIFKYIVKLENLTKKPQNYWSIYQTLEKQSMQAIIEEHLQEDDQMVGIRALTNSYQIQQGVNPYKCLIYKELQSFEAELRDHANLENELLFPCALKVENELKAYLLKIGKLC